MSVIVQGCGGSRAVQGRRLNRLDGSLCTLPQPIVVLQLARYCARSRRQRAHPLHLAVLNYLQIIKGPKLTSIEWRERGKSLRDRGGRKDAEGRAEVAGGSPWRRRDGLGICQGRKKEGLSWLAAVQQTTRFIQFSCLPFVKQDAQAPEGRREASRN